MQIIEMPTGDLIPYENNPRNNAPAVKAVAESIRAFGFKVPIVIDKQNVIVCGHTRLQAALRLGLDSVPCVRADDLTEEQVKAFRLADNKTAELAEWDIDKLEQELAELDNWDMSAFGFEAEKEPEGKDVENVKADNPITIRIVFKKKSDMQKIENDLREYIDNIEGASVTVQGGLTGEDNNSNS